MKKKIWLQENWRLAISLFGGGGFSLGKFVSGLWWDSLGGLVISFVIFIVLKMAFKDE